MLRETGTGKTEGGRSVALLRKELADVAGTIEMWEEDKGMDEVVEAADAEDEEETAEDEEGTAVDEVEETNEVDEEVEEKAEEIVESACRDKEVDRDVLRSSSWFVPGPIER